MTSPFRPDSGRDEWQGRDVAAIGRLTAGQAAAVAELYDRYADHVYSLAFRIVGSAADAEEVTEDVFAQAWRQASRYDPSRGTVAAWLLNMARTRAIDRFRANRSRPALSRTADAAILERMPDGGMNQEQAAIASQRRDRILDAVSALDDKQRRALELAYFSGLTHLEIAERLSEPLGTVKTRIRSGLLKLRTLLQGEDRPSS